MTGLLETTKAEFRKAVSDIRERLLNDLDEATNRRYSLSVKDRSKVTLTGLAALQYIRLQPSLPNLPVLIKERAYTIANRLVILMSLEARGLRKVKLVIQGIEKSAFRTEQEFFVDLCKGDDAGFGYILQQVWDQLALELPALFAYDEELECIPVPGPTLLWLLQELSNPDLAPAWTDDTTLGWLYQYWNDPDRKAVDEKLNNTMGKVEAHELANKTQLFTERYMVEWLVQNSLGAQWLSICAKNKWASEAQTILKNLESRRVDWNLSITQGAELASNPMPIHGAEAHWKFYVPQELSADSINQANDFLQDVKILDPAMGSGHFLVYVFDFLWVLYQDQSRLSGQEYTIDQILTWILTKNLYGIDIDNRAVQIAAAAIYIKVQEKRPGFSIPQLNLVASDLGLSHLKSTDPAVNAFAQDLEQELGLEGRISLKLIDALRGADYMGSLLQIDSEIDQMMKSTRLFGENLAGPDARARILAAFKNFIHDHDQGEDLGLSSLVDQLGKGLRLISVLENKFDIVLGNPPYLSEGKIVDEIDSIFIDGANELYEAMFYQGIRILKDSGMIAFISTHNFLFLEKFARFRKRLIKEGHFTALAQLGVHTFRDVSMPRAVGCAMFSWTKSQKKRSGAFLRVGSGNIVRDPIFEAKIPYLINQTNINANDGSATINIESSPFIYWWPEEFRAAYNSHKSLKSVGVVKMGVNTGNNDRFLRCWFESALGRIELIKHKSAEQVGSVKKWIPYVKGADGRRWFEPARNILNYQRNGIELKQAQELKFGAWRWKVCNDEYYFHQGLAFSYIGTNGFLCRLRKYKSIFDVSGSSIFCDAPEKMQVILSSNISGYVSQALNPTVNNQVGDIANLPVFDLLDDHQKYLTRAEALYELLFASTESNLEYAYQHLDPETFEIEEARIRDQIDKEILAHFTSATVQSIYQEIGESIFEFSKWDHSAENIPHDFSEAYQSSKTIESLSRKYRMHPDSILQIKGALNLVHEDQLEDEAFKHLSWAIGVLLGRFDVSTGGILELAAKPDTQYSHPHGLLYLSVLDDIEGILRREDRNIGAICIQSLYQILLVKWGEIKAKEIWEQVRRVLVNSKSTIGEWIRTDAFAKHKEIYENRPIYFPLVSSKKGFFVWVNIHRWQDGTLQNVLANYLRPDLVLVESRIRRLREESQLVTDKKARNALENEVASLDKLLDELREFVTKVSKLAEKGPDPKVQEAEAPYIMDLDDGVLVNSSALWELMFPLWKEPKKWWDILSKPAGKKDFDWSHLAMRYWPDRVYDKITKDPSLAIAHGNYGIYAGRDLFEELHPKAAKKWVEQQKLGVDKEPELEFNFKSAAEDE